MARIRVPRSGPGRPRTRPFAVLADRAYSFRAIRSHLRRRGIRAVISQPSDQIGHRLRRGRHGGRPPGFDREAYKQRNTVERCINQLKQWRGLATRTDKLAIAYHAALHLAGTHIWTRNWPKRQNLAPKVRQQVLEPRHSCQLQNRRPGRWPQRLETDQVLAHRAGELGVEVDALREFVGAPRIRGLTYGGTRDGAASGRRSP
ncbi:hypothetical protein SUDANB120_06184 (plasmid) [Streptomyces sp. enrichment culture]